MKFSLKVFIAVFIATSTLGSVLIFAAHHYVSESAKQEYVSRYSSFSKVMGDTLTRLDKNTEALMLNAAKVVEAKDAEQGLLSTDKLKTMRDEVSVTHIFVVDKNGNFIRSTNEDPNLIPNAFSFCPGYKNMVTGTELSAATPIIPPKPEPKPYKFVFVPSRDHQRLLEVGTRVDFIAKTLTEALGSDSNIISMSLFAPEGTPFGRFSSKDVDFSETRMNLPATFPQLIDAGDRYKFLTKVASSHPHCCQCDIAGISKEGQYYYVLESEISKSGLAVVEANSRTMFFLLALANLLFAFLLSRFISKQLVKNIETAAARVHEIKESGDLNKRIGISGKDEVAYLTGEIDHLLDSLQQSQSKLIEAEKVQARVQITRDVAHNIKSSVTAVEVMFPMLTGLPQTIQRVFRDSVKEIRELVERLNRQADTLASGENPQSLREDVQIYEFLERVVQEKQVEYLNRPQVELTLTSDNSINELAAKVDPIEFRAILSNLINNAVESYGASGGAVHIHFAHSEQNCSISIRDFGCGIPEEVIARLGKETLSSGKLGGRGLGLMHAYRTIAAHGGRLIIKSQEGSGTKLTVVLPVEINNWINLNQNRPGLSVVAEHRDRDIFLESRNE